MKLGWRATVHQKEKNLKLDDPISLSYAVGVACSCAAIVLLWYLWVCHALSGAPTHMLITCSRTSAFPPRSKWKRPRPR
jgi:hypothetical protein